MIAAGLCQCGCGGRTRPCAQTDTTRGIVRGEPRRFLPGHHTRTLTCKEPYGRRVGRRLQRVHVLIVEQVLGKPLPEGAHVHHLNGDTADNRHANLVACQDAAYHNLLHARARALAACGHAGWKRCRFCKTWAPTSELMDCRPRWRWPQWAHRSCYNTAQRPRQARRRARARAAKLERADLLRLDRAITAHLETLA